MSTLSCPTPTAPALSAAAPGGSGSPRQDGSGLYDVANEHDGCGVALVARLNAVPVHAAIQRGLTALRNLEHRGGEGADAATGDGAGITVQIPDRLLRAVTGFELPEAGRYGVVVCFLPAEPRRRAELEQLLVACVEREGQAALGWRDVPVRPALIGRVAREAAPVIRQLFVGAGPDFTDTEAFERKLYVIHRCAEITSGEELTVPSCSARTVVYKGMLTSSQVPLFYPDLTDERMESALALVHSRFSTNTFPNWRLAHPFRLIAHNGEVNTLTGNVNWMRAREAQLESTLLGADMQKVVPVIRPHGSDSASLDNALELLVRAGRSLPHALMMLVPQAWQGRKDLPPELVDFYRYHACIMEPWDGPACVSFTDGRVIGATLDRNGLRPGRWVVTRDGWVLLASEAGTLQVDESLVTRKGRLKPGKLFVVDLERHAVFADGEVEREVALRRPYGKWHAESVVRTADLPEDASEPSRPLEPLHLRQLGFGWSEEDLRVLVGPLAAQGKEPNGSMGNDIPLAVLSDQAPSLFHYFKQRFAQVTNPAIDPVREAIVMSLESALGPELNLLEEHPRHCRKLILEQPVLEDAELRRLRHPDQQRLPTRTLDTTWPSSAGAAGLRAALDRLCAEADQAIAEGAALLILSDRCISAERVPIPALLSVGAVHHHLVRQGQRLRVGLIVESGEPREVHHVACLLGYGAGAVNPYLLFESVDALISAGELKPGTDPHEARAQVIHGLDQGLLKILSKIGISTLHSYIGAQAFEAVGLDRDVIEPYFTGTASRIRGVGLNVLAGEAITRHARAYPKGAQLKNQRTKPERSLLPTGGNYAWRRTGELHMWNPETIPLLQAAVRPGQDGRETYRRFARLVNEDAARRSTLRGLMRFVEAESPVPLAEVEPASEIVKRFVTGAMSLGSISPETHETLAVAMNRLGGKSNTGEGGEDASRFGDERRSAIKQVASARFGVTIHYLVNADQLQIKVAQGAKPGEGGQLPGHKVSAEIARLRHSTPGVELISPPPHHDIYSIEDLKQLIFDLRSANPEASISVKLVAEVGVGTVAAGVAKANADHIVIAGHEGGTGSSPLSSIQHAGVPWELGLAEAQQTLVHHDLRSRVTLQADGQMKTGRDVVIAALLGAEEVGFSTAPLIAVGCIMMRVCHLNTCPVGIATQDPELRRRFTGTPEHVMNYLFMVAEEAREIMATLGVRNYVDLIGKADLLRLDTSIEHPKARHIDLANVLALPIAPKDRPRRQVRGPDPILTDALDHQIIKDAEAAILHAQALELSYAVRNRHRAVGGMLSSRIARLHGADGLPEGTLKVELTGSAGQSFGAWLAAGVELTLWGEANDYVGKGLSGGVIAVRPSKLARFAPEDNVIVGNTVLYGATGGRVFFSGLAGERFAVRNSGASAVVEGLGDHGCEYMTGGVVVVLGPTGHNFAAGMSGGVAYVYDPMKTLTERCNFELVDLEDLGAQDDRTLKGLIQEHVQRTGSPVGERLLLDWARCKLAFAKVMPRAYKRALAELALQQAGADLEAAPESTGAARAGLKVSA
jgi:glutamate synthase domain-containing protein 2/glutamate synthase domain-containing protein 1/glutamate synthase domain-containing protein 3